MASDKEIGCPEETAGEGADRFQTPIGNELFKNLRTEFQDQRDVHQPLGTITLNDDGSFVLDLSSGKDHVLGDVSLQFSPGDPEYKRIMNLFGTLQRGESTKLYLPILQEIGIGKLDQGEQGLDQFDSMGRDRALALRVEKYQCTPEHAERVKDAAEGLDDNVKRFLSKRGYGFIAADKVVDIRAKYGYDPNEIPNGYPKGWTWQNADGTVLKREHLIVVAEHVKSGPWVKSDRVEGVLRHETGHAVDDALGNYSHSAEFMTTYQKEAMSMPPEIQKRLSYVLQSGYRGYEEAFAEFFAIVEGGSARAQWEPLLRQYCPKTLALVERKVASLG
jgi:hypothetical protein